MPKPKTTNSALTEPYTREIIIALIETIKTEGGSADDHPIERIEKEHGDSLKSQDLDIFLTPDDHEQITELVKRLKE